MDKIEELLTRGVSAIYPDRERLESALKSGKKLKLYQGFDPTGIKLHIGHMVGLMKLKQWQELGHEVIFLIGDGTGQAGDPSGKTRARKKYLSSKELRDNAKDYIMQAGRIVKFDGPNAAKILYNGDWLNKLTLVEILNIANNFSLQQLEERDLYVGQKKRGEFINMREFFYPMLQAYDSVAMEVDLELGGEDQTFNMLCGRTLMKKMLNREKFVMTTPLLTDSKGNKIGKTEGNVIALDAAPYDFYGMIMSLSDDVIVKCFEYITDLEMSEVREIESKLEAGENPMTFKKRLAFELTRMLNDREQAEKAAEEFEKRFSKRELPENLEVKELKSGQPLVEVMVSLELAPSKSEARRLIEQGAVKINGEAIKDVNYIYDLKGENILQVGKLKAAKIKLND
ncbi:MAG: tyrosine--tRNA ligase [Candidatus Berkelbacteria bacterium]|nr:tyrosine--tRNA ligase [Candidatus Berkelbacteria bacterium]